MSNTPRLFHALLLTLLVRAVAGCGAPSVPPRVEDVAAVLDDWHAAAAVADEERYFGHFASDGVFLGTDDSERWTVAAFRAYAHARFSEGQGWTYVPRDRNVSFSSDGQVAWFDEKLDNESYGRVRGTGVLGRTADGWKIVHYSLSFPIPNDVTRAVVEIVRGGEGQ